jgi:DNA-binding transcriptional MerR regulator
VRLRSAALDPQQAAEGLAVSLAQIRQTLQRARASRPDDDPLTERLLEAVEQQAERLGQEIEQALRDLDRPPAEGDPP